MADRSSIDLRSDTVTKPTAEMRRAMVAAEVGDDVYGEDPTVRALEERAAALTGQEAALFVPSGTMGNQIAIHLHTDPGCDVLVERTSHVYLYELGAMAAWSGAVPRALDARRGLLDPGEVERAISPDIHYLATTRLLVLENTHNHAGGVVLPPATQAELIAVARGRRLAVHLDGARIFNAAAALDVPVVDLAGDFDTVMFCLSKGLGAPAGSMLCGSAEAIREGRVVRKRMGGGMRQVGVLAAAGLVALERHPARIVDDHARARRLAETLAELDGWHIEPGSVETNIVIADVDPPDDVSRVLSTLREAGVLALPMGPGRIRFVTHLDVDDDDLDRVVEILRRLARVP